MIYVFPGIYGASVVYESSLLSEVQKAQGIAMEALPEHNSPEGKIGRLQANDQGEVWWEYENVPTETELVRD